VSLEIVPVAFDDPAAVRLVAALDEDLDERYRDADEAEGEPDRAFLNLLTADVAPPHGAFLLARLDGEAVGCGALRRHDDGVGEVKRMYVRPDARGRGVARALLAALEAEAAGLGYRRLVLETGDRQPEAMALYETAGWTPIEAYGAYRHSTLSKCFEKHLEAGPDHP
jgi:GNAT superfamily N-acetyltransferase